MRALNLILCNVVIAAGIIVGRLEYEHEWERRITASVSASASSPVEPAVKPREQARVVHEAGSGGSPHIPEQPALEPSPTPASDPGSSLRLQEIRKRIQAQDFAAARDLALSLARSAGPDDLALRDEAHRLAAKARVFQRTVESIPHLDAGAGSGEGAEVLLANGGRIVSSSVVEEPGHYAILLADGRLYRPPKEDVLEVRRASAEARKVDVKALEAKVEDLKHPIDFYLGGVQVCYQNGLGDKGLELLERLLAMEGSDQIPLLFIPDSDPSVALDWNVASGRESTTLLAESAPSPPPSPSSRAMEPAVTTPPLPFRPAPLEGKEAPAVRAAADTGVLTQAEQLYAEAQGLYAKSARQEGKQDGLRDALDRLKRASALLESQPREDSRVSALRWKVGQLLSDVSRVMSW